MRAYFQLFRKKIYFGFLIILACACFGSFRGAYKEKREGYIGVTQEDISIMQQTDRQAPDLIGVLHLSSEQSRWYNFGYAFVYARRGLILYCILLAFYLPLYRKRFFVMLRTLIGKSMNENKLFINTDTDEGV